jgi:hypothetical protein
MKVAESRAAAVERAEVNGLLHLLAQAIFLGQREGAVSLDEWWKLYGVQ